MTASKWDLLDAAHAALRSVVDAVPSDGWDRPTPCERWNVSQVLQHAAGDQLGYAARLTGGLGPAEDPFAPSGVLAAAPAQLLAPALDAAAEAFAGVAPGTAEVAVPLPPFTVPAEIAVGAAALDAAVHAWDIAVATGLPSPLTPALAAALRPAAEALAEPLRGFAYGPALLPAPDAAADPVAALLAYLGRRPDWAPPDARRGARQE
ncbi:MULTISPECIES: TIGR03086 family metal-binding protein [Streptomyces]|uniref:TIGR03086 family protein n=1 Tax=Streptomyces flavotricini TaxID=66888 RepID=A0ABS8E5H5_9ACTN|nr:MULTISPECIES: TIGR03086 family metal-binding protein [Streptomyces]MCC0096241.1 TIGR03086 family protein [Streptomyces flavotricini]WSI26203.1 TIGR03086 family metal-binding protein [Streptomyces sp. NBC_01343]